MNDIDDMVKESQEIVETCSKYLAAKGDRKSVV